MHFNIIYKKRLIQFSVWQNEKKKLSVYTLADTLKLRLKSSDSTTMFLGLKTFGSYYSKLVTNISVKFNFCDQLMEIQTSFILVLYFNFGCLVCLKVIAWISKFHLAYEQKHVLKRILTQVIAQMHHTAFNAQRNIIFVYTWNLHQQESLSALRKLDSKS